MTRDRDFWTTTFYCDCDIRNQGGKLIPDLGSCGVSPRKNEKRASRIEWEHVMPAYLFGHNLPCWASGGRKECSRSDSLFKAMESDLHNLVPAVGEINGDRSNFAFGEILGEDRRYGRCDIEIDFRKKLVEPRARIRGDVARIYLYMADRYSIVLHDDQANMFIEWSRSDPATDSECALNAKKASLQGWENLFVTESCSSDVLSSKSNSAAKIEANIREIERAPSADGKQGSMYSESKEGDDVF